ncbi:MAG: histone-like nucleoid-structuring protein Lsr2 [Solirubrobacteraceae bacterium]
MAQQVQTFFVDDIDGSEAEATVRFGLDGTDYEIDLSVMHSEQLHRTLAPYLAHARKTPGAGRSGGARRGGRNAGIADSHKVRAWARGQGMDIKERGRIPANIMEKYQSR